MPRFALVALVVYFTLAFGWRSWLHWRRTGSTGFRGISGAVGSAEWCGGVLFIVALLGIALAPIAALADWIEPWSAMDRPLAHAAGALLVILGAAGTVWSQFAMGDAWRIGVDAGERTTLIDSGPFASVRNPIFTSMAVGLAGIFLMVPNSIAALAFAALIGALELQVRLVEEPYLCATHGDAYRRYAARTGRFVPGLGRLR